MRETARCSVLFRNVVAHKSQISCTIVTLQNCTNAFKHFLPNFLLLSHFDLEWPWMTLNRYLSSQRLHKFLFTGQFYSAIYTAMFKINFQLKNVRITFDGYLRTSRRCTWYRIYDFLLRSMILVNTTLSFTVSKMSLHSLHDCNWSWKFVQFGYSSWTDNPHITS